MSTLRIIAGKAKGLRIQTVPGDSTRPITDRVRENLFNILGSDIIDANILDLFGGTGSVSLEALSRGAAFARLIDLHPLAIKAIKANIKHTKLTNSEVIKSDALVYIKNPPDRQFEYIYIAPPQYKEIWIKAFELLDQNPEWATDDAWVIVQIHPVEYKKLELKNFEEFEQRKYGSTLLIFYEKIIHQKT